MITNVCNSSCSCICEEDRRTIQVALLVGLVAIAVLQMICAAKVIEDTRLSISFYVCSSLILSFAFLDFAINSCVTENRKVPEEKTTTPKSNPSPKKPNKEDQIVLVAGKSNTPTKPKPVLNEPNFVHVSSNSAALVPITTDETPTLNTSPSLSTLPKIESDPALKKNDSPPPLLESEATEVSNSMASPSPSILKDGTPNNSSPTPSITDNSSLVHVTPPKSPAAKIEPTPPAQSQSGIISAVKNLFANK